MRSAILMKALKAIGLLEVEFKYEEKYSICETLASAHMTNFAASNEPTQFWVLQVKWNSWEYCSINFYTGNMADWRLHRWSPLGFQSGDSVWILRRISTVVDFVDIQPSFLRCKELFIDLLFSMNFFRTTSSAIGLEGTISTHAFKEKYAWGYRKT